MRRIPLSVALAMLMLIALPAHATDYTLRNLRIGHPYALATPPGARSGGVYLTIENLGTESDRLVRVASPAASSAELHSMTMDGNVMRMRPIARLDIAPRATVTLGSGGYHVMLAGLARPWSVGDSIPITLTFEKAGSVEVSAPVESTKGPMPARDGAHLP